MFVDYDVKFVLRIRLASHRFLLLSKTLLDISCFKVKNQTVFKNYGDAL